MEVINPYLGKYSGASVFLNHGKYGPYLNYNTKLYSVPKCFEKPTFNIDDAIKIIEYKKKMKEPAPNRKDYDDIIKKLESLPLWSEAPNCEPKGVSEDLDDIIKKVKSKKKVLD